MNVLIIGGGGRENAISKSFIKNKNVRLYSIMEYKNQDILKNCTNFLITKENDLKKIIDFIKKNKIDLVFIGPEAPLETDLVDILLNENIITIGPRRCCAKIETDKSWMRKFIDKYNLKCNPKYKIIDYKDPNSLKIAYEYIDIMKDVAIKPIGLSGGKGVKVIGNQLQSISDAKNYVKYLLEKESVIIEEKMNGDEYTLQAFVDGTHLLFCPLVKDYKRLLNNNDGENTGGMGSYTDFDHLLPFINKEILEKSKKIMENTIKYLYLETGFKYKGILYGQFILTNKNEIKLVEYNARFGDPESINILSLLKTDFLKICLSIYYEYLDKIKIDFIQKATVCKYLVPKGYPNNSIINQEINIKRDCNDKDIEIYFANVNFSENKIYTTKSRSIAVLGIGNSISEAEKKVENFILKNGDSKLYHRSDIGKLLK